MNFSLKTFVFTICAVFAAIFIGSYAFQGAFLGLAIGLSNWQFLKERSLKHLLIYCLVLQLFFFVYTLVAGVLLIFLLALFPLILLVSSFAIYFITLKFLHIPSKKLAAVLLLCLGLTPYLLLLFNHSGIAPGMLGLFNGVSIENLQLPFLGLSLALGFAYTPKTGSFISSSQAGSH